MSYMQIKSLYGDGQHLIVDAMCITSVAPRYVADESGKPYIEGTLMMLDSGDMMSCADNHVDVQAAVERITQRPIIPVKVV